MSKSFKKSNSAFNFVSNLLFPPKCMNCGELLDVNIAGLVKSPLCDKCRIAWEKEKNSFCPECGFGIKSCSCMPRVLKRADCSVLLKLVSYRSTGFMPIRNFIYSLKHRKNRSSFEFVAEQLRFLLIGEMRKRELKPSNCIICFLPRSYKNKNEDGFDQSKELASELSSQMGIELANVLKRKFYTKEEKKLNKIERTLNMNSAFYIADKKGMLSGKTVILVDDIVTSGSSMASATRLCISAGAYEVIGACVGYTYKIKKHT